MAPIDYEDVQEPFGCSPNQCLNGGTCVDRALRGFKCACAEGFSGVVCQFGKLGC